MGQQLDRLHFRMDFYPNQSQEGTGWCYLGVLCALSVLVCVASQVYSDTVCACVSLGNTC